MDPRKSQRWIPEGEGIFLRGGCPRGQQSLGELAVLDASSPDDAAHGPVGGVGWFEYATSTHSIQTFLSECAHPTPSAGHENCTSTLEGLHAPRWWLAEDDEPLDRTPAVPSSIVHHP